MLNGDEQRQRRSSLKSEMSQESLSRDTSLSSEAFLPSMPISMSKNVIRKSSRLAKLRRSSSSSSLTPMPRKKSIGRRNIFYSSTSISMSDNEKPIKDSQEEQIEKLVPRDSHTVTPKNDVDTPRFDTSTVGDSTAPIDASTFQVNKVRRLLEIYSQTNTEASRTVEARTLLNSIHTQCNRLETLQRSFQVNQMKLGKQMSEMSQDYAALQLKVQNTGLMKERSPTLYQKEVEEEGVVMGLPEVEIPPYKSISKFRHLNIDSDGDTFCSQSDSSSSSNPIMCPIEEIQSSECFSSEEDQGTETDNTNDEDSLLGEVFEDPPFTPMKININQSMTPLPSLCSYDNPETKKEHDLRIIFQNCRGAFPSDTPSNEHYVPSMESCKNMLADAVLLSETNTDWTVRDNYYNVQLLNNAIWKNSPTKTTAASCKWENPDRRSHQTGGVLSVFANSFPSRISASTSDKYGRWTKTSVQLKTKSMSIYNTYRTHAKNLQTAGIETPWMQQWMAMRTGHGDSDLDPRSKHMEDLRELVEMDASEGNFTLIMGDFNEDVEDKEDKGLCLLEDSPHLVNVFMRQHGQVPSSRRNSRSICHVYASPQLVPFINRLGVCTANDAFLTSDHIPFFLDLDPSLFSTNLSALLPKKSRILQMYNSIGIETYVHEVRRQFQAHNIIARLEDLRKHIRDTGFDVYAIMTLEKIDAQVTSMRLLSEKKLIKRPTRYKHTDIAKQQVQKIRLLKALRKKHKKGLCCTSTISRLENMEILSEITPDTIDSIITQEKQELKQIQSDIDVHREEHLTKLYERKAAEEDKALAQVVSEMKMREKQQKMWRKISFVTKRRGNSVTRLGIPVGYENKSTREIWDYLQDPSSTPTWEYITCPDQIEERLLQWQQLHYNQAGESPFASESWGKRMCPTQISERDMIANIRGGLDLSSLHASSRQMFEQLQRSQLPPMPQEATDITVQKFRSFYGKAPEKTSSSPSGLHMGHWKAASKDAMISEVLVAIISIAITHSYALNRWKKVVGILLEKNLGHPYIHKFRTIHLVESDLNFVMRLIWGKDLMKWAEKHEGIHNNQYGGRKGVQAQTAALNKTLSCDIIRYYAEEASLIDNDAQACYDRIVPAFLSCALMRLGLPFHLVKFQCEWLKQAMYNLKLTKGLSKSYSSSSASTLYGTGQGTGWSPPSWTALSDIISRVLEKFAPGIKLQHPDGSFLQRVIDAFVDDVNSGLTIEALRDFTPVNEEVLKKYPTIYEQTQWNIQLYSRLLFTTGGRLALHKCAIYFLRTIWKDGKRSFEKTHENLAPVPIIQGINQGIEYIRTEDPSKARRMLGVYVAPDGNSKKQFQVLRTKSEVWSKRVRSQHLNGYETLMAYNQGIMKSLEYPVGSSHLTKNQCEKIQSPALKICLQKNGIASTISRRYIFGPTRYGCLGLQELYTELGTQKVEMLIGHARKNDNTNKILRISLGCLQQEVGITRSVLQCAYDTFSGWATHSWMKQLWQFLSTIGGTIRHIETWTPKPTFSRDVNIMEEVAQWEVTQETKYKINICRLFKRCYFISDLLDPLGIRFLQGSLTLQSRLFHTDKFPNIQLPKKFEEVWQYAIRRIVQQKGIGRHLGFIENMSTKQWTLDETKLLLIQKHFNKPPTIHFKIGPNKYRKETSSLQVPVRSLYVVNISAQEGYFSIKSFNSARPKSLQNSSTVFPSVTSQIWKDSAIAFKQYLHNLPEPYRSNVGKVVRFKKFGHLLTSLQKNQVIAVGDASVDRKHGAHSFVLESKDEKSHISFSAPVVSDVDDLTSNRAEGCSVLAILTVAIAMEKFFSLGKCKVEVFCDNDEAMRFGTYNKTTYSKLVKRDIDIKLEMTKMMKNTPITFKFSRVKGHLDDDESFVYEDASQEVQRNIDMDKQAAAYLEHTISQPPPSLLSSMLFEQKAALYLQNTHITGDIRNQIALHAQGHRVEETIQKSLRISQSQMETIEWEGIDVAFRKLPAVDKISRMKIMHKSLPVRALLNTRNGPNSAQCPRCDRRVETYTHIFQCTCPQNKSNHRQCMKKFRDSLRKAKTHVLIINAFDMLLTNFHHNRPKKYSSPPLVDATKIALVRQVFQQQNALGQEAFARGFLTRNWMLAQNVLTLSKKPEAKNLPWLKNVIRAIWTYSHSMWVLRCKQVHSSSKNDPDNLTHQELIFSIRQFLRISRTEISSEEKLLHLNITRGLRIAHSKTLVRWIRLLTQERQKTIRNRRKKIRSKGGFQTITRFLKSARTEGVCSIPG